MYLNTLWTENFLLAGVSIFKSEQETVFFVGKTVNMVKKRKSDKLSNI